MPAKFRYDEGTFAFRPELHENCGNRMAREFSLFVQRALEEGYRFVTCEQYRAIHRAEEK